MELSAAVHEEITLLLGDARKGSALAQERLYAHVYRELHRLAERPLRGDREHGGATSLVHEAFFKLSRAPTEFNDRQHFFALAARAMRRPSARSPPCRAGRWPTASHAAASWT